MSRTVPRAALASTTPISGARFSPTDSSRASLCRANLEGAAASGVILRGADLWDANLAGADLTDADLRGADLTGANLEGAILHGADLRGAIGAPATAQEQPSPEDIPAAFLPLAETMTPIVRQILQTAGQSGTVDAAMAARLLETLEARSPQAALPPEALTAVTRVMSELGTTTLPALFAALKQRDGVPPAEVKELIRRLAESLQMPEGGTTEDLLQKVTGRRS